MKKYFLQPAASARLEEVFLYTLDRFGPVQADEYLDGVFALFEDIAERRLAWQPIPSEFRVDGFFARYGSHFVFWKLRSDNHVAIVAILHQRMDMARRLREAVGDR
ncbi:MAG: type II toxin-antitoxin system RelE/ParE family toxin [Nitratireductor sp.]